MARTLKYKPLKREFDGYGLNSGEIRIDTAAPILRALINFQMITGFEVMPSDCIFEMYPTSFSKMSPEGKRQEAEDALPFLISGLVINGRA